jgi:hypothetical protein
MNKMKTHHTNDGKKDIIVQLNGNGRLIIEEEFYKQFDQTYEDMQEKANLVALLASLVVVFSDKDIQVERAPDDQN